MSCAIIITLCVVFIYQPVDELSEGLIWASREGCLEDVVFLLTTGVEVNSRGQVRLRMSLSGGMSSGAIFSPYLHCYTGSPWFTLGLAPSSPSIPVTDYSRTASVIPAVLGYSATGMLGGWEVPG